MFLHRSSSFLTFSSNTFSVNSTLLFKPFYIYFPRFFIPSCDFLISSIAILKFALIKFPMFFSCFSNFSLNIYPITFMFPSLKNACFCYFEFYDFFFRTRFCFASLSSTRPAFLAKTTKVSSKVHKNQLTDFQWKSIDSFQVLNEKQFEIDCSSSTSK